MQDWLLVVAPIVLVAYWVTNPNQFTAFLDWLARLIH
jgi:hypothetical protein